MQDRHWARENQLILEITGNTHPYLTCSVAGLRLAVAVTYLLIGLLNSLSSSQVSVLGSSTKSSASMSSVGAGLLASNVLLTLSAATSFLVDVREAAHHDADKFKYN